MPESQSLQYRPEVDGLRAVAVLPVIMFHAGFPGFAGGFVGVDVFFVISGYLIASIIISELDAGKFSIVNFYERRARRILPALFFVMACCLLPAWLWMMPENLTLFSGGLTSVSVFLSNVYFWINSGYWDPASELNPLVHTWSLAVEEQFYVIFPLFLMALWRFKKGWIAALFAIIVLLSLWFAEYSALRYPNFNFYSIATRFWELGIGVLIAFAFIYCRSIVDHIRQNNVLVQVASVVGLGLIAFSIVFFDETTPFPSLWALVPTIGAALVILFATPATIAGIVLSSRPFVFVGLMSYSAYLWHQPLFAFARLKFVAEPGVAVFVGLAFASLVLGWVSLYFVERPFRAKGKFSRRQIFSFSLLGLVLFGGVGLVGTSSDGWPQRVDSRLRVERVELCRAKKFQEDKVCDLVQGGQFTTILMGDSHSGTIAPGVKKVFDGRDIHISAIYKTECLPVLYQYENPAPEKMAGNKGVCSDYNHALFRYIKGRQDIEYVILTARWVMGLQKGRFDNQEGGVEHANSLTLLDHVAASNADMDELAKGRLLYLEAIQHTVQLLLDAGKKVILVYPIPEAGWHVPTYLFAHMPKGTQPIPPNIGSTNHDVFKARHKDIYQAFDALGHQTGLQRVYPENVFCNSTVQGRCITQMNGHPLYRDDDHLSVLGGELVAEEILKAYPAQ